MPILRLAYTTLFLIALLAVFEVWSQVGGQSHLDLMPWYLKLALGGGTAFATVKTTAAAADGEQVWNRQTLRWAGILVALLVGCGLSSYYYHLYEEQQEEEENTAASRSIPEWEGDRPACAWSCRKGFIPAIPTGPATYRLGTSIDSTHKAPQTL